MENGTWTMESKLGSHSVGLLSLKVKCLGINACIGSCLRACSYVCAYVCVFVCIYQHIRFRPRWLRG